MKVISKHINVTKDRKNIRMETDQNSSIIRWPWLDDIFKELEFKNLISGLQKGEYILCFHCIEEGRILWDFSVLNPDVLMCIENKLNEYLIPHENFIYVDGNIFLEDVVKNKTNILVKSFIMDKITDNWFFEKSISPFFSNYHNNTVRMKRTKHFTSLNNAILTNDMHRLMLILLIEKLQIRNKFYLTVDSITKTFNDSSLFNSRLNNIVDELGLNKHNEKVYQPVSILKYISYKYNITPDDVLSTLTQFPIILDESKGLLFTDSYFYIETLTDYSTDIDFPTSGFFNRLERVTSTFHPFIIFGPTGSLQKLRDNGFKTFSSFIDESYDEIVDDAMRFDRTFDEILKLSKLSIDDIHKMCIDMEDILIHNRNNFIKLTTNPETVSFLDDYIINPFVKLS